MPRAWKRPPRVALLALSPSVDVSWVVNDARMLRELGCRVTRYAWRGTWKGIPDQLRLAGVAATHDLLIAWFAYKQACQALKAARWLGKPVAAIAGGFETSASDAYDPVPEQWRRARGWTLDHLDAILALSEFSAHEIRALTDNRVEVLYLGADGERFRPAGPKAAIALTIASSIDRVVLKRKGIEAFLKAAALAPDIEFQLVGRVEAETEETVRRYAQGRVKLLGRLSDDELLARLQRAAVYVQASLHEGFGMAVAEAMSCECVPVVTRAGALPEVTGDTGVYVSSQDPLEIAKAVQQAMDVPEKGKAARERILREFPLARRRKGLRQLLERTLPDFPMGVT